MSKLILAVAIILSAATPATATAEPMGIGSCYEVRPLCMYPQTPLCICDSTMNCFWVCK